MMKWSEMSIEERDRLVRVKFMGGSIGRCAGIAYYTGRVGMDEYYCETCKKYYYDIEDGGKHDTPIPAYSTDMNAAMSALLHLGKWFKLVYDPDGRQGCKYLCLITIDAWRDVSGWSDNPIWAMNLATIKTAVEIEP